MILGRVAGAKGASSNLVGGDDERGVVDILAIVGVGGGIRRTGGAVTEIP